MEILSNSPRLLQNSEFYSKLCLNVSISLTEMYYHGRRWNSSLLTQSQYPQLTLNKIEVSLQVHQSHPSLLKIQKYSNSILPMTLQLTPITRSRQAVSHIKLQPSLGPSSLMNQPSCSNVTSTRDLVSGVLIIELTLSIWDIVLFNATFVLFLQSTDVMNDVSKTQR